MNQADPTGYLGFLEKQFAGDQTASEDADGVQTPNPQFPDVVDESESDGASWPGDSMEESLTRGVKLLHPRSPRGLLLGVTASDIARAASRLAGKPELPLASRGAKRALDVIVGALGLVVNLPLLLLIATLIKVSSPGPILFKQVRVGQGGKTFLMLKFRTMVSEAPQLLSTLADGPAGDGVLFKFRGDPRVTRIGRVLRRYSLDELPQLINIIRGDMSLVGPRAPLPREVETFDRRMRRLLLVRPGLTGLWQVSGRSAQSWDDAIRIEMTYVETWSLRLDAKILLKTIWAVIRTPGAY